MPKTDYSQLNCKNFKWWISPDCLAENRKKIVWYSLRNALSRQHNFWILGQKEQNVVTSQKPKTGYSQH